ncbi:MAG: peptidase M20, partial [Rhodoferax sp.]
MNARVSETTLNAAQVLGEVSRAWDDDIVHRLEDYIRIPAKSPAFDADWAKNGFIDTVMWDAATWVQAQKVEGLTLEIIRLEGRTPVLFFEVPASTGAANDAAGPAKAASGQTVLMYGHLDKQPEFTGWR